ncbi:26s proteasome regulatory subunit 2 [Vairimorpha apis BRL 01]|uniref:26s proteasome regulatory subunit 2 n=1 Tax=Vairimorpha apis BRL 01 TaxID=1037528 RepID=T0L661_9MICR|nr:26s proteasome regulatory subunit 2 [Vairimorpha apis BRL 01]
MIHLNNPDILEVLKNYLPSENNMKEGGSFIALGLNKIGSCDIVSNEILLYHIKSSNVQIVYGACIGLGLINMCNDNCNGSCKDNNYKESVVKQLKDLLYEENTVFVEGSILALCIMCCGSESEGSEGDVKERYVDICSVDGEGNDVIWRM